MESWIQLGLLQVKTKQEKSQIAETDQWLENKKLLYKRGECGQSDSFSLSAFPYLLLFWESNQRESKIIRLVAAGTETESM